MFKDALKNNYIVPAFNFANFEILKGILFLIIMKERIKLWLHLKEGSARLSDQLYLHQEWPCFFLYYWLIYLSFKRLSLSCIKPR